MFGLLGELWFNNQLRAFAASIDEQAAARSETGETTCHDIAIGLMLDLSTAKCAKGWKWCLSPACKWGNHVDHHSWCEFAGWAVDVRVLKHHSVPDLQETVCIAPARLRLQQLSPGVVLRRTPSEFRAVFNRHFCQKLGGVHGHSGDLISELFQVTLKSARIAA